MTCGSVHPEMPDVTCKIEAQFPHQNHRAIVNFRPVEWPNTEFVQPPAEPKPSKPKRDDTVAKEFKDLVDRVNGKGSINDDPHDVPGPETIRRDEDPWTSHLAAVRIQPTRGTRKANVLERLMRSLGQWVDGTEFVSAEVGGTDGLTRLRELRRTDGWPIERRPHPTSATAWQYRLVADEVLAFPSEEPVTSALRDFG